MLDFQFQSQLRDLWIIHWHWRDLLLLKKIWTIHIVCLFHWLIANRNRNRYIARSVVKIIFITITIIIEKRSNESIYIVTNWIRISTIKGKSISTNNINMTSIICWNTNSSTTSNTLDFLWTPSVLQACRLFVWISFINHSCFDLNIQDCANLMNWIWSKSL